MSGTTRVSRYQKGKTRKAKTNLDLPEQEIVSGSGMCWAICTSAPHPRQPCQHPTTQFLQARCPSWRPTNSIKALKAISMNNKTEHYRLERSSVKLKRDAFHFQAACRVHTIMQNMWFYDSSRTMGKWWHTQSAKQDMGSHRSLISIQCLLLREELQAVLKCHRWHATALQIQCTCCWLR